jgi:hypothetical protein
MAKLEELTRGASVKGVLPNGLVTVIDIKWHGEAALELTYKHGAGKPGDVSAEKCGDDIESRVPGDGKLQFIEVKGRTVEAETVTVSRNEILTALNKPEDFILAIAQIDGQDSRLHYLRRPFQQEPEFSVESINYKLDELLKRAELIA